MSALLLDDMSAWPHLVAFYQANNIINLLREGSVLIDPRIHHLVAGRAGIHNRFCFTRDTAVKSIGLATQPLLLVEQFIDVFAQFPPRL